jgi:hypothetical protein
MLNQNTGMPSPSPWAVQQRELQNQALLQRQAQQQQQRNIDYQQKVAIQSGSFHTGDSQMDTSGGAILYIAILFPLVIAGLILWGLGLGIRALYRRLSR